MRQNDALQASAAGAVPLAPEHLQACVGGFAAGVYPCRNIDLLEFMPHSTFGTASGNSVKTNSLWGWTDPLTGHEWVLLGLNNGTAFIDISNPEAPYYAGRLPTHSGTSNTWRDMRVYQNYAYIVSEQVGHGMQIFDLTQLRSAIGAPDVYTETAHYNRVSNTHTISINEQTGYAYLVGTTGTNNNPNVLTCGGNMHIVSLANPISPQFVGCYNDGGYIHENQCFVYAGPDLDCDPVAAGNQSCAGREVCLASRGTAHNLDIIDVSNHASPVRLSSLRFNNIGYAHQAWFTEDQRYILLNDELDEQNAGVPTRTWIFDASNLNAPVLSGGNGYFQHATAAIDHNLYVRGSFVFESNYRAGLRILALTNLAQSQLEEVAFFDVFPANDQAEFDGTWNNYPFFASGVIPVTHLSQGLFLLKPSNLCSSSAAPTSLSATPAAERRVDLSWTGSGTANARYSIERAFGGCAGDFTQITSGLINASYSDLDASGGLVLGYRVRQSDVSGVCTSEPSSCVEAKTSGSCTAAPSFGGLLSATSAGLSTCQINLSWPAATAFCGGLSRYSVYRGSSDNFVPTVGNRIASGLTGTSFEDLTAPGGQALYYIVRATDLATGIEDSNLVRRQVLATGPIGNGNFSTGAEVGDPILDTFGDPDEAVAAKHAGWHLSTTRVRAGDRSFFSTSSNSLCVTLETPVMMLTAGQVSTLSFWTAWDMQAGFDGGVVDISTNGGGVWSRLTPAGGYPGTIANPGNACAAMPSGTAAFTGTQFTWQQKSLDLSAFAGQNVKLAWRFGSDAGSNGEGWYVDDIELTHAQVPGSCVGPFAFADGFEDAAR